MTTSLLAVINPACHQVGRTRRPPLRHLGLTDCRRSIYHSGGVELWAASFSNEVSRELASAAVTRRHTCTAGSESKSGAAAFNPCKVHVLVKSHSASMRGIPTPDDTSAGRTIMQLNVRRYRHHGKSDEGSTPVSLRR